MTVEFHAQTHPGLVREGNEDAVAVDADQQVAVLADGMGGYNAGEVASAMAAGFICSELGRWLAQAGQAANSREIQRAIALCADNANRSIFDAAHTQPAYAGMGTTLVLGVFQGSRAFIGHAGDSRCYRLRGQRLQALTRDHSLLQEQIDAGLLSPEQAQHAPHKNLVTRALGVEDAVLLEVNEFRVEVNDLYLFCSDGLSDMLAADQIAAILMAAGSLRDKAGALIAQANAHGGHDNISVILARQASRPQASGWLPRLLGRH